MQPEDAIIQAGYRIGKFHKSVKLPVLTYANTPFS
jgi:hypothetical protein